MVVAAKKAGPKAVPEPASAPASSPSLLSSLVPFAAGVLLSVLYFTVVAPPVPPTAAPDAAATAAKAEVPRATDKLQRWDPVALGHVRDLSVCPTCYFFYYFFLFCFTVILDSVSNKSTLFSPVLDDSGRVYHMRTMAMDPPIFGLGARLPRHCLCCPCLFFCRNPGLSTR